MPRVAVIDYGMGNLLSVTRALEYCGSEVTLVGTPEFLKLADRLILPGVGAFVNGMDGLRRRGLIDAIRSFADSGKPFLGICLGMQMMLESSEEFGHHEGLGLISGRVVPIPSTSGDGTPHKIPHIGWNELLPPSPMTSWEGTILQGLSPGVSAYFVHSFTAIPSSAEHRLAECDYNGRRVSAVIRSGALYGCQFHPEKSGEVGLAIIRKFLAL